MNPAIAARPFGSPDGSRANIETELHGFVRYEAPSRWGALATQENDLSARIFAGRKGSGKTIYLRRLRAWAATRSELYAAAVEYDSPDTSEIVRFSQWYQRYDNISEKWARLWRCAIIRTVVSHILVNKQLRQYSTAETRTYIATTFAGVLRKFETPTMVCTQVAELIRAHPSAKTMDAFLKDHRWSDLENVVREHLHSFPVICIFLDALDNSFEHAPSHWLRCQEGLFVEAMRLLRDPQLGNKLHLMVCLRDIVLATMYSSEHATRIRNEPYIRILNWSSQSIQYFLEQKLAKVPDEYFLEPASDTKTVESWLGINEIENARRGVREPIQSYLIRHTRGLPRDIIQLGNDLCGMVMRLKRDDQKCNLGREIAATVAIVAARFGDEQLQICGNEVAAYSMPRDASKYGIVGTYTTEVNYLPGFAGDLKKIIARVGKDRFNGDELRQAQSYAKELLGLDIDIFSVLWRNGLLGYTDERNPEEELFCSETYLQMHLPLEKHSYTFHPILIDSVALKAVGQRPVIPKYL